MCFQAKLKSSRPDTSDFQTSLLGQESGPAWLETPWAEFLGPTDPGEGSRGCVPGKPPGGSSGMDPLRDPLGDLLEGPLGGSTITRCHEVQIRVVFDAAGSAESASGWVDSGGFISVSSALPRASGLGVGIGTDSACLAQCVLPSGHQHHRGSRPGCAARLCCPGPTSRDGHMRPSDNLHPAKGTKMTSTSPRAQKIGKMGCPGQTKIFKTC